jgi:glutamine phosphoribosylpyrophosphate amidotransferase
MPSLETPEVSEDFSSTEMPAHECGIFSLSLHPSFYEKLNSIEARLNYLKILIEEAFNTENFQDPNSKPLVPVLLSLFRRAIFDSNFAEELTKEILKSLNHRGPHGFGLGFINPDGSIRTIKYVGELDKSPLFEGQEDLLGNPEKTIGHLRYATAGSLSLENAHPHFGKNADFELYLSHNGNIQGIQGILEKRRLISNTDLTQLNYNQGDSDSALFAQAIAEARGNSTIEKLKNLLPHIPPSYSCSMITQEGIFAFRDRGGNRPLFLCEIEINNKKSYIIASETVAFEKVLKRLGLNLSSKNVEIEEIKPGEIVHIDNDQNLTIDTFLDKIGLEDGETENNPVDALFESLDNQELTPQNLSQTNLDKIIKYLLDLTNELGNLPCFIETVYFSASSSRIFANPILNGGTGLFLNELFEKLDQIIQVLNQSENFISQKREIQNLTNILKTRKKGLNEEQTKMLISEARKQIGARLFENSNLQEVLENLGFNLSQQEIEMPPETPENTIISYIPNGGRNFAQGLVQKMIERAVLPKGFEIPNIFQGSSQRVFLANSNEQKQEIAAQKFEIRKACKEEIKGKTILLVDDSLVRGTNIKICVKNLLELGAEKVIIISASPVFKDGCHLGVALTKDQLLSTRAEQNQDFQSDGNLTLEQKMAKQLIQEINQESGKSYSPDQLELVFGNMKGIEQVVLQNGSLYTKYCTKCLELI